MRLLLSQVMVGVTVVCSTGLLFLAGSPLQDPSTSQFGVRMIVVNSPEEAEKILERLNNGEEFAVVARENSAAPNHGTFSLARRLRSSACAASLA